MRKQELVGDVRYTSVCEAGEGFDLPKQEDRGIAALGDRDLRNLLVNRRRATAPARPARSARAPPGLIKAIT